MNFKILMERLDTIWWSILKTWSPTSSVFLLKKWALNLCATVFLFCHTYCLIAGFTVDAENDIGTFATNVVFAWVFFPIAVHLILFSLLRSGQNWHLVLVQGLLFLCAPHAHKNSGCM